MKEFEYYTVVFAVSRALGCMANLIWARAFGLPIERPGSITLRWIEDKFGEHRDVKWSIYHKHSYKFHYSSKNYSKSAKASIQSINRATKAYAISTPFK